MKALIFPILTLIFLNCNRQGENESSVNPKIYNSFSLTKLIDHSHPNFSLDKYNWRVNYFQQQIKKSNIVMFQMDSEINEVNYNLPDSTSIFFNNNNQEIKFTRIWRSKWCVEFNTKYDNKKRILSEVTSHCDSAIQSSNNYSYYSEYETITHIPPKGRNEEIIFHLDNQGNKIIRQDFRQDSILIWKKKYDVNNNVVDFKFYYWNDSLEFHETYKYSKKDVLISSSVIKSPSELINVGDFDGGIIVRYDSAIAKTYQYDYEQNSISITKLFPGNDSVIDIYTFDNYGNLLSLKQISNNQTEVLELNEYKYDKLGSVIEQKEYLKSVLNSVWYFTHEYFD